MDRRLRWGAGRPRAYGARRGGPRVAWPRDERKDMTTISTDKEIQAVAQQWFARLLAPDCSQADREAFERWESAAPANRAAYAQVESVWRRSASLRDDPAVAEALREALRPAARPIRSRSWRWPALAAAASVVVAVALLLRMQMPEDVPAVRYTTALGEQRTVVLDDGSQVVLDTNSTLLVQFGKKGRTLTVQQGQADFNVQRDPERPFVVHATGGSVTAIGTQFQVRVHDHGSTVTLLEGQVQVAGQANGRPELATLTPNERIEIEPNGRLALRRSMPPPELAAARGWTAGNLVVEDWPLRAVLAEMNRYSSMQLRLDDPALGEIPISGIFKAGDLQSFALALEYGWAMRVNARPTDNEVVLSRK